MLKVKEIVRVFEERPNYPFTAKEISRLIDKRTAAVDPFWSRSTLIYLCAEGKIEDFGGKYRLALRKERAKEENPGSDHTADEDKTAASKQALPSPVRTLHWKEAARQRLVAALSHCGPHLKSPMEA